MKFTLPTGIVNLSQSSATTSAQLAAVLSDETGTGSVMLSASPALTGTPTLGGSPITSLGNNLMIVKSNYLN